MATCHAKPYYFPDIDGGRNGENTEEEDGTGGINGNVSNGKCNEFVYKGDLFARAPTTGAACNLLVAPAVLNNNNLRK